MNSSDNELEMWIGYIRCNTSFEGKVKKQAVFNLISANKKEQSNSAEG